MFFNAIKVVYVEFLTEEMRNLPRNTLKTTLRNVFEEFGPIHDVWIMPKKSRMPKYGLVQFYNRDEGETAIGELNFRLEFEGWCSWNNERFRHGQ